MTVRMASPQARARIAGLVYLIFFVTAIVGELFAQQAGISGFGVSNDAAATAKNLLSNESSFQIGFALSLISIACYVAVTALFYQLLKPVSASLSLIAAFLSLMGQAVAASGYVLQLAPLVLLKSSPYLSVFNPKQVQALALTFLNMTAQVGNIALVFDGLFLLVLGYLILRSTFLPRILGGLVALAGLAWLAFLAPPLAKDLSTYVEVVGAVAEAALMLWLLVKGVNSQRWNQQAGIVTGR